MGHRDGTQDSRTDIPPRAGGGGARRAGTLWTRSLAYASSPGHGSGVGVTTRYTLPEHRERRYLGVTPRRGTAAAAARP